MTGTPIQNTLDELASLAGFLKLLPFSSKQEFQRHILAPLADDGTDATKAFRAYLQAYCLRRTELDLPKCRQKLVHLTFSTQEQTLYKSILSQTKRNVDDLVSKGNNIRNHNILFTALLRMRIFCNHGTLPASASGYLAPDRRAVGCERCSAISEDDAVLLESVPFCPNCGPSLHGGSPNSDDGLSPSCDFEMSTEMPLRDTSFAMPRSTKLSTVVENIANYNPGCKQSVDFSLSWSNC